jgi:hypothetical protein
MMAMPESGKQDLRNEETAKERELSMALLSGNSKNQNRIAA